MAMRLTLPSACLRSCRSADDMQLTPKTKSFHSRMPIASHGSLMFERGPRPAEQIAQLEALIAEVREAIRRSRRLILAGRVCAFAGAALLLCLMLGFVTIMPIRMIVAIVVGL